MTQTLDRTVFAQQGYRCKLEWGWRGAKDAAERGDSLIVVDVLSFSSAAVTGTERGAVIKPCHNEEEARLAANIFGGEVAVNRRDVPTKGHYSLSPQTFADIPAGTHIYLPSPNGATCVTQGVAGKASQVFVGALLNARAIGKAVSHLLQTTQSAVTVLACGERWWTPGADGDLRFALEDYVGAGAILTAVRRELAVGWEESFPLEELFSPEACVCLGAFETVRARLASVLWECGSGRELRAKGYGDDVTFASCLDACEVVPCAQANGFLYPYAMQTADPSTECNLSAQCQPSPDCDHA